MFTEETEHTTSAPNSIMDLTTNTPQERAYDTILDIPVETNPYETIPDIPVETKAYETIPVDINIPVEMNSAYNVPTATVDAIAVDANVAYVPTIRSSIPVEDSPSCLHSNTSSGGTKWGISIAQLNAKYYNYVLMYFS